MNRLATSSIVASMLIAATVLALVSCSTRPPATSPLSPMWVQLHYPTPSGTWVTQPQLDANLLRILPVQGRAVRVDIQANLGTFGVTLRELNGTLTPLTQLPSGGVPTPGAGFFEVAAVNVNAQPPIQTLVVRAPATIADPANYDVLIVARSSAGGVPDSAPLIIPLRAIPNFTVTVTLNGSGRVTSDLPGISCGTSQNICTAEFMAPVTLAAQSATSGTMITFRSWEGSCTPSGQRCTAVSSGGRTAAIVANFQASTSVPVSASCPTPPTMHGRRWIAQPICSLSGTIQRDLKCDAQGYFCCATSGPGGTARCNNTPESSADCTHVAPRGQLIQPGGCYEASP